MSNGHCTLTYNPGVQGVGASFSSEASAVLSPPAQTEPVRFGEEEISPEQPPCLPAADELDEDGWGDPDETEEAPYSDPADELVATIRLYGATCAGRAKVEARLSYGADLDADDIADLSAEVRALAKEEGGLLADIAGLLREVEGHNVYAAEVA